MFSLLDFYLAKYFSAFNFNFFVDVLNLVVFELPSITIKHMALTKPHF